MPTFDFRCKKCEKTFEGTVAFGAKKFPTCPKCASKAIEKLMSPPSIHFKGSGFYKTDSTKPANDTKPASGKKSTPSSES